MSSQASVKRSFLIVSGALVASCFWLLDEGHLADRAAASPQATTPASVSDAGRARSGVFAIDAMAKPAVSHRTPASTPPAFAQEPPFPYSFLGKIVESGEPTILLFGAGRTFRVQHTGPLDATYVVDEIYEDHVVIRYLPLGTRHIVELVAREFTVPAGLRGEYPQD